MASRHRDSPISEVQHKNGPVKQFKKSLLGSSWKQRYLKLNKNYLLIFETQHTFQPLESVVRNEIRSVRKLSDVANGFEIKIKEFECHIFQTESSDELEEWVAALESRVPVSSARLDSQAQVVLAAKQANKSDFPAQFESQPAVLYPGLPSKAGESIEESKQYTNDTHNPPPYNTMF